MLGRIWFCLVFLSFLSEPSALLFGAPSAVKLRYSLAPALHGNRLVLHITVTLDRLAPRATELVLPSTWGGAQSLSRAVANLQADSPDARIIDSADPSNKTLQGSTRGRVSFSYDLVKDWDGPLREAVRHRPHLEPTYLAINTNNALIHPKLDLSTPVECIFDWKLPPGWTIATSFGAGAPRQRLRGPWSKVQQAIFVAGDFRIEKSKLGKGVLVTAIRGTFGVPDTEIRSRIVGTIRMERDFWKDDQFPYYLVSVVPFDQGQGSTGGDGLTKWFQPASVAAGRPFARRAFAAGT